MNILCLVDSDDDANSSSEMNSIDEQLHEWGSDEF